MILAYDVKIPRKSSRGQSRIEDVLAFYESCHKNCQIDLPESVSTKEAQKVQSGYITAIRRLNLEKNIKVITRNHKVYLVKIEKECE